jgi:hypothetical protein
LDDKDFDVFIRGENDESSDAIVFPTESTVSFEEGEMDQPKEDLLSELVKKNLNF